MRRGWQRRRGPLGGLFHRFRAARCTHYFLTFMEADGRLLAHEVCRGCGARRLRREEPYPPEPVDLQPRLSDS
jgi:hypothetical protein